MDYSENSDFSYIVFKDSNFQSTPNISNSQISSADIELNPISLLESITKGENLDRDNLEIPVIQDLEVEDIFLNEISSQYINGLISFDLYKKMLERGWAKKGEISNKIRKGNKSMSEITEDISDDDSNNISDDDYDPGQNQTISEEDSDVEIDVNADTKREGLYNYGNTSKRGVKRKTRLPKHLQGLMGTANLSWVNGNKPEAEDICNQIIRESPSAHEPYALLSLIYEEKGHLDKSSQYALIAAHLDCTNSPDPWLKLAEQSKKNEKYDLALDYFKKANNLFRKYMFQKRSLEDNIISQYISCHYECAQLNEKQGDIKKATKDYQSILDIISHQRKYEPNTDHAYKPMFINITQTLSKLYHTLKEYKLAHDCLKEIFDIYPLSDIDIGLLNLFLDVQLTQSHYYDAMVLMGKYFGISWLKPGHMAESCSDSQGIPDHIPSNFPLDLQCKLAICIINLQREGKVLSTTTPHYFNHPYYHGMLKYLEKSLLEQDPDTFGDLFIDMTEAYKNNGSDRGPPYQQQPEERTEEASKEPGATEVVARSLMREDYRRSLPFYHKILGLPVEENSIRGATKRSHQDRESRSGNYATVPGIWLAYAETLEFLGDFEGAVGAMGKVVSLAPHHQLSHFKLKRMVEGNPSVQVRGKPRGNSSLQNDRRSSKADDGEMNHKVPQPPSASFKGDSSSFDLKGSLVVPPIPGTKGTVGMARSIFKEASPFPSPNITLSLLHNLTKDAEMCEECLDQCLTYRKESRAPVMVEDDVGKKDHLSAHKVSGLKEKFLSLGLSIFFTLGSEGLKPPYGETFYRSLVQTVIHDAERRIGARKDGFEPENDAVKSSSAASTAYVCLPLTVRHKLERLFELLVRELKGSLPNLGGGFEGELLVGDDLLFLYLCAMGNLGVFTGPRYRENLRYQTLCAVYLSKRWRYTVVCTKCVLNVLVKSDWFLNHQQQKSTVGGQLDTHQAHAANKLSSVVRVLNIMVHSLQKLQSSSFAAVHGHFHQTYNVIGDNRSPHIALTRKICTFLLKQVRVYDLTAAADASSPAHNLRRRQRKDLSAALCWAYATLNHGIGGYGVALFEYRHLLATTFTEPPPELTSAADRGLNFIHVRPLLLLSMGTALIELACGPKLYWWGPYPRPTTGQSGKRGGSVDSVCHSMVPLSYGFVCLAAYAKIRGPCQEVYYNLGRAYHQVDLLSLAVEHYNKALELGPPGGNHDFDLTRDIAYNLVLIYKSSGSYSLASYISQKYLVI